MQPGFHKLSLSSSDCPMKHFCTHTLLHALHAQSSTGRHDTHTQRPTSMHTHHWADMHCFRRVTWEMVAHMHRFSTYMTHPSGFTLVFNGLLSVWHCPLHIVYRVFHIVLYTVYHLPLGEVGYRGGEGAGHGDGGGVQSGKQGDREGRGGGKRDNRSVWGWCASCLSPACWSFWTFCIWGRSPSPFPHTLEPPAPSALCCWPGRPAQAREKSGVIQLWWFNKPESVKNRLSSLDCDGILIHTKGKVNVHHR